MSIEAALFSLLTSNADVSGKIADRLYPKVLPQDPSYPAGVYHKVSGAREHSHDGASGLARPRFQFDLYATSYAAAIALATAVREAIDGFKGISAGVSIEGCFLEDEDDGYDDELKVYWVRQDYAIWHNE